MLTKSERDEALALLRESESEMLGLLDGITDPQWSFKASPDRWSIGETVEHVAILEPLVRMRILGSLNNEPNPEWEAHQVSLDRLRPGLLNRAGKISAPELLHPKSEMSRDQVIASFLQERSKTIAFAETTDAQLKRYFSLHPVLGNLSAFSWLLALALHTMRHNLQIAEVRSEPAFPDGNKATAAGVE